MSGTPDLTSLNAGERAVLALLAQGHTAKSIAAITGRTLGSVNERLREARRKTGVGSSRELARALAAQENGDKQIGMAGPASPAPVMSPRAVPHHAGGILIGVLTMIVVILSALALLPSPQETPAADPLLGGLVRPAGETAEGLYTRLRAEPVDAAWAPQAEAGLRTRFLKIPSIAGDRLRVTCRTTLCEVAGVLVAADAAALDRAYAEIQGKDLRADMRNLGFTGDGPIGFGASAGSKVESRFYAYLTRRR
jgi:DNA-binding CsgD family transcriptional regulator